MPQKQLTAIEKAANSAINMLAIAADKATSAISSAAIDATKLLASQAQDAARITNSKSSDDHDLLVELKTKMEDLKGDIKELKDGTSKQIDDHEVRIGKLETGKTIQTVTMGIGIAILGILTSLLIYHLVGK